MYELFLTLTGQLVSVCWSRPVKVKKGSPAFTKHCRLVCRAGVQYDKMKAVREKRESGELPAENAGLPWGEWDVYPYVISHKGAKYLRFSFMPNNYPQVEYRNEANEVVSSDVVKPYAYASEFQESESQDVMTIKAKNIVSIGGLTLEHAQAA